MQDICLPELKLLVSELIMWSTESVQRILIIAKSEKDHLLSHISTLKKFLNCKREWMSYISS